MIQKLEINLPPIFNIYQADVTRIGPHEDGGYWVETNSLISSDKLISFGMNDDWRFEKDFHRITKKPLEIYDGSVSLKLFRNNFLKELLKIIKFSAAFEKFKILLDYYFFFDGKNIKHYENYVGMDYANRRDKWLSFSTIMNAQNNEDKILLKCDIEGGEYRLLDEILKYEHRLTGIIIEFHDIDFMLERVTIFIENSNFKIVAINVNNYGMVNKKIPTVIECTFAPIKNSNPVGQFDQIKNDPLGFLPVLNINDIA